MSLQSRLGAGTRQALMVLIGFAGVAKIAGGVPKQSLLPEAMLVAVGCIEVALALALLTARWREACIGIAMLAAVGIVLAVFFPGRSCGCLGTWMLLSRAEHLLLACAAGTLAGIALSLADRAEMTDTVSS